MIRFELPPGRHLRSGVASIELHGAGRYPIWLACFSNQLRSVACGGSFFHQPQRHAQPFTRNGPGAGLACAGTVPSCAHPRAIHLSPKTSSRDTPACIEIAMFRDGCPNQDGTRRLRIGALWPSVAAPNRWSIARDGAVRPHLLVLRLPRKVSPAFVASDLLVSRGCQTWGYPNWIPAMSSPTSTQ